MSLTTEDILKIANLARLEANESATAKYVKDLSNIFNLVAEMEKVDTSSIKPMAHPMAATQRLRPDEITEPNQRELFQSIAPEVKVGLYLVPKVIE